MKEGFEERNRKYGCRGSNYWGKSAQWVASFSLIPTQSSLLLQRARPYQLYHENPTHNRFPINIYWTHYFFSIPLLKWMFPCTKWSDQSDSQDWPVISDRSQLLILLVPSMPTGGRGWFWVKLVLSIHFSKQECISPAPIRTYLVRCSMDKNRVGCREMGKPTEIQINLINLV